MMAQQYATNSKAFFDYEILKKFSAGLELTGSEVKSVREGKMNLKGSYVTIRDSEAYLIGSEIPAYQPKNTPKEYDSGRPRKLLLSKNELDEIKRVETIRGLTIIPISVYNKGRFLKIDIAIARGKKKYDKRESIKRRDIERDLGRSL